MLYLVFPLEKRWGFHVGRSLGQSVDQVLLAQYLLTPFFDTYQTWYSNGSGKHIFPFEFHITWSKVKVNVLVKIKLQLFFIPIFFLNSQYIMIVLPYFYQTSYIGCIRGQEDSFCISGPRSRSNLLSYSEVNCELFI